MSLSSSSYTAQQELINSRTEAVFAALHLRSFVLRLPIVNVPDAEKTRQGIYEKILKNRSFSCTRSNPRDELTRQPNPDLAAKQTEEVVQILSAPSSVGFVLVVVEESVQKKGTGQAEYCPVGGGVVEVVDEHERSIRGMWCRRSLPPEFSALLMKALCLRVFAQAFEWPDEPSGAVGASPGGAAPGGAGASSRGTKNPYRLVSCTEKALLLFPRDAVKFLTESLMLSKHWETELDGGSHNDHPTVKCKCQKLSKLPGAWQFYGICESRFLNYWRPGLQFRNFLPDAPPPALCDFLRCRQGHARPTPNGRRGSLADEGTHFKENEKEARGSKHVLAEGGNFASSSFNGMRQEPASFLADATGIAASGPGTRQSTRRQQHELLKRGRAAFASFPAFPHSPSYSSPTASASPPASSTPASSTVGGRRPQETLRGTTREAAEAGRGAPQPLASTDEAKLHASSSQGGGGSAREDVPASLPAEKGEEGIDRHDAAPSRGHSDVGSESSPPREEGRETSANGEAVARGEGGLAHLKGGDAQTGKAEQGSAECANGEATAGHGEEEPAAKRTRILV
ncbi:conserved hypothetical protein [Neospora caninum Liverpool]|uniref:Uncharacterized protein n=1 Tax=Neospora caninum (strain Liverpool) TaxID=572307 RepID=F0VKH5_NEOCL|nr:conserved hypothetical protein [Neospora caninum Liverpool]CBZ54576.1 conserved hypothetical protein [Neospora caninum Liverpool]CEL69290.1 TPA: hypothetical protein BN1204_050040 [Neospora caninum Liverpool]|eukprot:XP_003884606.1 conserved hypothetical protein [Neospora caninum Liverpool]